MVKGRGPSRPYRVRRRSPRKLVQTHHPDQPGADGREGRHASACDCHLGCCWIYGRWHGRWRDGRVWVQQETLLTVLGGDIEVEELVLNSLGRRHARVRLKGQELFAQVVEFSVVLPCHIKHLLLSPSAVPSAPSALGHSTSPCVPGIRRQARGGTLVRIKTDLQRQIFDLKRPHAFNCSLTVCRRILWPPQVAALAQEAPNRPPTGMPHRGSTAVRHATSHVRVTSPCKTSTAHLKHIVGARGRAGMERIQRAALTRHASSWSEEACRRFVPSSPSAQDCRASETSLLR